MNVYEFGYRTYEESEITQLVHLKDFSQDEFEEMLLDCICEASRLEVELNFVRWHSNYQAKHVFEAEEEDIKLPEDKISLQEHYIKVAMDARLRGDERLYQIYMSDAHVKNNPCLSYQQLHSLVVKLMCSRHGFSPMEKLRTAYLFGWSDLSKEKDWDSDLGDIDKRASKLVRDNVYKYDANLDEQSVARSERRDFSNLNIEDRELCEGLGIEYIPFEHPIALKAREEHKKSIFQTEELLSFFVSDAE